MSKWLPLIDATFLPKGRLGEGEAGNERGLRHWQRETLKIPVSRTSRHLCWIIIQQLAFDQLTVCVSLSPGQTKKDMSEVHAQVQSFTVTGKLRGFKTHEGIRSEIPGSASNASGIFFFLASQGNLHTGGLHLGSELQGWHICPAAQILTQAERWPAVTCSINYKGFPCFCFMCQGAVAPLLPVLLHDGSLVQRSNAY